MERGFAFKLLNQQPDLTHFKNRLLLYNIVD